MAVMTPGAHNTQGLASAAEAENRVSFLIRLSMPVGVESLEQCFLSHGRLTTGDTQPHVTHSPEAPTQAGVTPFYTFF